MRSARVSRDVPGEFQAVSSEQWEGVVDRFADASLYQTSVYGSVSWGEHQVERWILGDGDAAAAMAMVRVVAVPFLRVGVAYVRWGPCCQLRGERWSEDAFARVIRALVSEYVEKRGLLLRLTPHVFADDQQAVRALEILRNEGFAQEGSAPYRTVRVGLDASRESLRRGLAHKWRNQLNAAERNGLEIHEGTSDLLFAQFRQLYEQMMTRKQFETSVDVAEFGRMQALLPERQKMHILIGVKNGVAQSGVIASSIGETGIYLLGATGDAGRNSKASYLLQWHMMGRLQERGCRWYDLGGINPDTNPGVFHFKQGMGGVEASHIGAFARRSGWASTWAVAGGEKARAVAKKLRRVSARG
jgi:hypothetical protein